MKKLLIVILLFVSTIAVGQIDLKFQYRYIYNSDLNIEDKVWKDVFQEFQTVETNVPYSYNSYFGAEAYIPFSSFDPESPLSTDLVAFSASAYFLYNHNLNKFSQQYYKFGLHYQPFKRQKIHFSSVIDVAEIFENVETTVWTGYDFKVGVSYNTFEQSTPDLINFFASLNFIAYSEYYTLRPKGNLFVSTNDFETIIGIIINIEDIFFIEQGIRTYTESNLPALTFSPYYSDYKTKFTLKYSNFELDFTHICFHPIVSTNDNPEIYGVFNSVGLTYKL